jgi:hypothetical protein
LEKFKFFLLEGRDCFLRKKGLSFSLEQLKLLLPRDMIVPRGKTNFLGETYAYVSNLLAITIFSYLFFI